MINLYDILDSADGQLFGEAAAQIFSSFSFDPTSTRQGDLFVALKTETHDGHAHMEEAVKAGALGLMCTHPPTFDTQGITVMIMRDVEAALLRWTRYILQKYGVTVLAILGERGKVAAGHACAQILSGRYAVHHRPTDYAGRFSVPLGLSGLNSSHQLAIVEVNTLGLDDLSDLGVALSPAVALITSYSGSDSPAALAPLRHFLNHLPSDGLAVLNFDQAPLRSLAREIPVPSLTVSVDRDGTSFGADLTAYNLLLALDKTGFDLRYGSERHLGKWTPLLGAPHLYAALMGLAVGLSFDVPLSEGLTALTRLSPLPGRLRPLAGYQDSLLLDHSANADLGDFQASLEWLKGLRPASSAHETQIGQVSPHGKIFVVVGELNEAPGADLRSIAQNLRECADVLVTEGEGAARWVKLAVEAGFPLAFTAMTYSPLDAALTVKRQLSPKDVVLISGNASARLERVVTELLKDPADHRHLARYDASPSLQNERPPYASWLQVDLDAIARNTRRLADLLGPDVTLMAVVKGDAYGHGLIPVSTTALLNGAAWLGVSTLEEGLQVREAGLTAPVLILGHVPSNAAAVLLRHNLTPSLFDANIARAWSRVAHSLGKTLAVHVRLDLGDGGLGLPYEEAPIFFRTLGRMESLQIEGIYAHPLDSDPSRAEVLLGRFNDTLLLLGAGGIKPQYRHLADSTLALHLPSARLNMVRCGAALFGLNIHPDHPLPESFQPALTWKSTIVQVKRQGGRIEISPSGQPITHKARPVGILPLGYADGLPLEAEKWGGVLLRGQRAPLVGKVGFYQTLVDLSGFEDVHVGEEVILLGGEIRPEAIAKAFGGRADELLSILGRKLPRLKQV
jgi:alanine racemase